MEELKNKIYQDINESDLQIDAIYYLFKDIMRDISDAYAGYLINKKGEEESRPENMRGELDNGKKI